MQPRLSVSSPNSPGLPWRVLGAILLFFFILELISLLRTWHLARQARQSLKEQTVKTNQMTAEVEQLERDIRTATSSFTLEERARNELRLQKPNEIIINTQTQ